MEQFTSELPLFTDAPEAEDTKIVETDSEIVKLIKEILDTRIRPTVQEDGGDIVYRHFDEKTGIVHLYMKGSCSVIEKNKNNQEFNYSRKKTTDISYIISDKLFVP